MNILLLNWKDTKNPKSGGAEIVTMAHAEAWINAGHRVTWFTSCFPGASRYEKINGVNIVRYGTNHTVHFLAPFYYFFSNQSFDIVIDEIHGLPFFTPLYVRKPKIAFIHEVAGVIWDYMSTFPFNTIGKLIESYYFYFYRNVQWWTDATSTIRELSHYGIPKEHCMAIPCPVSNGIISRLPKKEHQPTFLFVSRLVRMKGIEDIIEAFRLITLKLQNAQLWIVGAGDGRYVNNLNRQTTLKGLGGKVRFFGEVTQKQKLNLMKRAHLLLHASIKEGWGLVVLEAASQGTPAVVYDVPGLNETVKDGRTGIVLPENSPQVMARESIELFRDNKRYSPYQRDGIIWARSLQWSDVTKQSLKLLTDAVKRNRNYANLSS